MKISLGTTLGVRFLARDHLQDTHPEGIDISLAGVVALHSLRCHEFKLVPCCGNVAQAAAQPEVTQLHLTIVAIDEDVIALQLAVDDWGVLVVEVLQRPQQLSADLLNHPQLQAVVLGLRDKRLQGPTRHHFCDGPRTGHAGSLVGIAWGITQRPSKGGGRTDHFEFESFHANLIMCGIFERGTWHMGDQAAHFGNFDPLLPVVKFTICRLDVHQGEGGKALPPSPTGPSWIPHLPPQR